MRSRSRIMLTDDDPATPEIDGWQNVARAIMLRIQTYRCGHGETLIPRESAELSAWRELHQVAIDRIERMMD
jgi:hypothetical protein